MAASPDDRPGDAGIVAGEMTSYLRGLQERLRQAELRRVEAQAKASAERTRRRLGRGPGGGGRRIPRDGGWGRSLDAPPARECAARVDLLLRDAEDMKARAESVGDDLARWAVARETIRRASSIVDDARDAATRNRVLKLEQEIAKRDRRGGGFERRSWSNSSSPRSERRSMRSPSPTPRRPTRLRSRPRGRMGPQD